MRRDKTALEELAEEIGVPASPEQSFSDNEDDREGMPEPWAPPTDAEMEVVHHTNVQARAAKYFITDTNIGHRAITEEQAERHFEPGPGQPNLTRQRKHIVYTKPHPHGKRDFRQLQANGVVMLIPMGALVEVRQTFYELLVQSGDVQPLNAEDWAMYPQMDARAKSARANQELSHISRP